MEDVKLKKVYPKLRFLVIDDFESFRSSLRLMLSSFGAEHIEMASNAEDALNKCKYDFFDVILCDFNLGHGKNGQQILEELRVTKRLKHTHLFVMITAETSKDVVLSAREYQPDGYVAKPITRTVLEQRLGQLLTQQKILKPINRQIDLQNYPKAIRLCHDMLETGTRYKSWCYQTLAKLYTLLGDSSSAEKIYRDVLKSRELPWARLGMGEVFNMENQYQEAKRCFETVISTNPNLVEAYDGMSESYLRMGQPKRAQEVLQTAVELSPRMVPRQQKLGEICLKNQDIEGAVKALRKAVHFGENSVHESAQHYLELGRCLSEWAESEDGEKSKALANEALLLLDKAADRFSHDEEACTNSLLIEARIHQGQGHHEEAAQSLHKAECALEEENMSASVGLELAKTLYTLDNHERAENLLLQLSKRFENDSAILAKIESLMDEPEGITSRIKAKELNKQGISEFEKGKLDAAIESFKDALTYTPKHAALNLNLVQVAIKAYKHTSDPALLESAHECLDRLSHIPEQHHQFNRLKHFRKVLAKLSKKDS